MPSPTTADNAFMANATIERGQRPGFAPAAAERVRHFHTWLPRQMVAVGLFGVVLLPVALYFLDDDDHIGFADGRFVVDSIGRESLRVVVGAGLGSALVGWLLWTVAAALNARSKSRWSISPYSLPMAYVFVGGLAIGAAAFTENFTNKYSIPATFVVAGVGLICHLGVFAAFRRAAVAIGAPDTPWTRAMVLPSVIALVAGLGAFFTQAIASPTNFLVFSGLTFALTLLMVASWVQAMSSFDRSCVGRQMSHETMEIPAFLRSN